MILSILLPTIHKHRNYFRAMKECLKNQEGIDQCEIVVDESDDYNIGTKRNKLLDRAKGTYSTFIDVDDVIAYNYVKLIVEACKEGSDCIGISGTITTNGKNEKQWHISKKYGSWRTENGVYLRTTNHISPVKTEIARQAGFPETKFGEDYEYSMRLIPLLKTETIVKGNIYWYRFISNKLK